MIWRVKGTLGQGQTTEHWLWLLYHQSETEETNKVSLNIWVKGGNEEIIMCSQAWALPCDCVKVVKVGDRLLSSQECLW